MVQGRTSSIAEATPGAKASPRSRRAAGLVMYTLTGNYKSDQVHAREHLERLAQRRGGIWWRFGFSFIRVAPGAD